MVHKINHSMGNAHSANILLLNIANICRVVSSGDWYTFVVWELHVITSSNKALSFFSPFTITFASLLMGAFGLWALALSFG
jgi:hypothetical protein